MRHVPLKFAPFDQALEILDKMSPTAMAIVGSYGNPEKTTDQFSDLDLIYVFDTNDIRFLIEKFIDRLDRIDDLIVTHLGVHFQFGHVISFFFRHEPLCWVDIGMMDRNFAENYLVDMPMRVLKGSIPTCGIPSHPGNQMQHIARKLMKALLRNDRLYVANCACRYVTWLHVEAAMARRVNSYASEKFALRQSSGGTGLGEFRPEDYVSNDLSKIVDAVLRDIAKRFPEITMVP